MELALNDEDSQGQSEQVLFGSRRAHPEAAFGERSEMLPADGEIYSRGCSFMAVISGILRIVNSRARKQK